MKGNMFKFLGLMAVVALISSLSLVASADATATKVAVVDARMAILTSTVAKKAVKSFEESDSYIALQAKYESNIADFQAMAKEVETNRLTWSEDEVKEHQKKMSYVKADAELTWQKITTELQQLQQRILQNFQTLAEQAIQEIVKEEGIVVLLRAEAVLLAAPETSITDKVADRIDAKSKNQLESE